MDDAVDVRVVLPISEGPKGGDVYDEDDDIEEVELGVRGGESRIQV